MTPLTTAEPAEDLSTIRAEIDDLDDTLQLLVAARLGLARRAAAAKGGAYLFRPARARAVLARVSDGPVPAPLAHALWSALMAGALAEEGTREIVVTDAALVVPAMLRFGTVLPVRTDPGAGALAPDAIVIVARGTPPPPGAVILDDVLDGAGAVAGHIVGPAGERA